MGEKHVVKGSSPKPASTGCIYKPNVGIPLLTSLTFFYDFMEPKAENTITGEVLSLTAELQPP